MTTKRKARDDQDSGRATEDAPSQATLFDSTQEQHAQLPQPEQTPHMETLERILADMESRQERKDEWREREQERKERRREEEQERKEQLREEEQDRKEDIWIKLFQGMQTKEETNQMFREQEARHQRERNRCTAGKDAPTLAPLKDVQKLPALLNTFAEHMKNFDVDKKFWVGSLLPLLDEVSLGFVNEMQPGNKKNYETVAKLLLDQHNLNPFQYREQWIKAKPAQEETLGVYSSRILLIVQAWTKDLTTIPEFQDLLVRENLLKILSPEARMWVDRHEVNTAKEVADLGDKFYRSLAARDEEKPRQWEMSRQSYRQTNRRQTLSGRTSDSSINNDLKGPQKDLPPKEEGTANQPNEIQCYRCHKYGHVRATCPLKTCMIGLYVKSIRQPPSTSGTVNGITSNKILLDTGVKSRTWTQNSSQRTSKSSSVWES